VLATSTHAIPKTLPVELDPSIGNDQKLPNPPSLATRRFGLKQHKSNEPVSHLPPQKLLLVPQGLESALSNEGKPPQSHKRKAESGSRVNKDEVRSSDGARLKQFNIKSGLLNMKNKAHKALNDITGIVLNNIKKDATNTSGNSGST